MDGHNSRPPVYYQGKEVGQIRKFSDTLLIFLLKGARPETYRERHEHTGKHGGPIQYEDVSQMTDEQLDEEFDRIMKKARGEGVTEDSA